MNSHRRHFFAAALTAVLLVAPALSAQILGARPWSAMPPGFLSPLNSPGPAVFFPDNPTPPTVTTNVKLWDEIRVARVRFSSGGAWIELDQNLLDDWRPLVPPARQSMEWSFRWGPAGVFGLTPLPAQIMPDSLEPSAWAAYLRGLQQRGPGNQPAILILCDDDSDLNHQMLRPLGRRTRVLEFEFLPPRPLAPPLRIIQVFISTGHGAWVFTFRGPAPEVQRIRGVFENLLLHLQLGPDGKSAEAR